MRWSRVVGWLLVVIGVIGFLTIADDLDHAGEVLGVASVLVVGVLLVVAGFTNFRSIRVAMLCLAGAVGVGAVIGAAIDNMLVGTGGGVFVGAVLAAVLGLRRERASA